MSPHKSLLVPYDGKSPVICEDNELQLVKCSALMSLSKSSCNFLCLSVNYAFSLATRHRRPANRGLFRIVLALTPSASSYCISFIVIVRLSAAVAIIQWSPNTVVVNGRAGCGASLIGPSSLNVGTIPVTHLTEQPTADECHVWTVKVQKNILLYVLSLMARATWLRIQM